MRSVLLLSLCSLFQPLFSEDPNVGPLRPTAITPADRPTPERLVYEKELEDFTRQATAAAAKDDETELKRLLQIVEGDWKPADRRRYAERMLALCNAITASFGFSDMLKLVDWQHICIERALDKHPQLDLRAQFRLVEIMRSREDFWPNLHGRPLADFRQGTTRLICRAWKNWSSIYDPAYDVNVRHGTPVLASPDLPAGIDPAAVKDPQVRAAYEAALAKQEEAHLVHARQLEMRKLQDRYFTQLEDFIARLYAIERAPDHELEDLLTPSGLPVARQQALLARVTQAAPGR